MVRSQILSNSTKILEYIEQKGEASINEIRDQLNLQKQEVYLAVGWLACEKKVYLRQDDDRLIVIFYNYPHSIWF
jgi:DNA-binding IclR family transcriptional regulator